MKKNLAERALDWLLDGPIWRVVLVLVGVCGSLLGLYVWVLVLADEDCAKRGKRLECHTIPVTTTTPVVGPNGQVSVVVSTGSATDCRCE